MHPRPPPFATNTQLMTGTGFLPTLWLTLLSGLRTRLERSSRLGALRFISAIKAGVRCSLTSKAEASVVHSQLAQLAEDMSCEISPVLLIEPPSSERPLFGDEIPK